MTTHVWNGLVGDGDWDNDGNWDSVKPAGGGALIIISATADSITKPAVTGLTTADMKIGPGFTGTLGTLAAPIDIDCTTLDFESNGSSAYISGDQTTVQVNGGSGGSNWLTFVDDNPTGTYSTTITTLRVLAGTGTVTVPANSTLTNAEFISAAGVTLNLNQTTMATFTANSGTINSLCNFTTALNCRGTAVHTMTGSSGATAVLTLTGDARLVHQGGGAITQLNAYAGVFDGSANPNSTVTVTDCTIWDALVDCQTGLRNYVFTNPVLIEGAGQLRPSLGQTLTVT